MLLLNGAGFPFLRRLAELLSSSHQQFVLLHSKLMHLSDEKLRSIFLVFEPLLVRGKNVEEFDECLETSLINTRNLENRVHIADAHDVCGMNNLLLIVIDSHDELLQLFKHLELFYLLLLLIKLCLSHLIDLSDHDDNGYFKVLHDVQLINS